MKSISKIVAGAGVLALLAGCAAAALKYSSSSQWVPGSFTAQYLPLADQADTWSNPKPFSAASGNLTVQSRFNGQEGTTCKFTIQFNNVGTTALSEQVIVTRPGKAAVGSNDIPLQAKLKAGTSVAYNTEVRECPLNWGETKDMAKCASCEPMVYFVRR